MIAASRFTLDPLASWPVLAVIGALSVLVWVMYLSRGGKSWLLRALGMTVLGVALLNPLLVREQREPLKDIVALVRDRSESMRFAGRTEAADAAFETLRAQLAADDDIELRIAETPPGAAGTEIYGALMTSLSDAPRDRIAGALLITDGQVHDLPDAADNPQQLGPIHSLVVGEDNEFDRRIEIVSAPNFGIVGDTAELAFRVEDPASGAVDVTISVNGETRRVRSAFPGEVTTVQLDIPRRGENLVVLETSPGPEELTLANNRTAATISGVRDRLRVLLVTGEPHAGARVWRDLLKADPSVDLVHFTILRPPFKMDPTPIDQLALISFPTRELFVEKLDEFDLVIFDRYKRINVLPMSYFEGMTRYVANGGAMLIAVGPPYASTYSIYRTPLSGILPVRPNGRVQNQSFNIERTELGKRHTVTASLDTPENWGPWERYVDGRAIAGETLLQADTGAPLLVLNRVEDGRVATLMSDQLWLWARGYQGGGPYAELVRRTAHWLMKEPELEEELLSLIAEDGKMRARMRTLKDAPSRLEITDPDGQTLTATWAALEPGVFEAVVDAPRLGLYSARAGDLSTVALNGPANPQEYEDVRSSTQLLTPLAEATRGGVFRIGASKDVTLPDIRRVGETGAAAGSDWAGLRRRNAYAVRASQATALLPGALGMMLALLAFFMSWRREGR